MTADTLERPEEHPEEPTTDVVAETVEKPALRVVDRCDRCIAQAMVLLTKPDVTPSELILCKHHYERHEVALITQGFTVLLDDRETLTRRP